MKKVLVIWFIIVAAFSAEICSANQNVEAYVSGRQEAIENIAGQSTNVGSSRSYVHKALAMLYLEKDIDSANEILCSDYIANADFYNDTNLLYWSMPALTTLYYMFNQTDPSSSALLSDEANEVVKTKLYEFLIRECDGQIDESINALRVPASENHNLLMKITTLLISAKLADYAEYKDVILPCGDSIAQYNEKVRVYLIGHLDFCIKNAVMVEGGDTYVSVSLESIYNLYGFTSDETLKKQAKTYLDLYWIKFTSESIDLIKSGAKSRCYSDWAKSGENWLYGLAAIYFGETVYNDVKPLITPLLINYYPPNAACEIVNNPLQRGSYEYIERNAGAGTHVIEQVAYEEWPVYYYDENETITRYSYVTPDYILGSFIRNPNETYVQITSQNQFEGAVLKDDERVYSYVDRDGVNVHNAFLSMQKGDVLISKKGSLAGNVGIYISEITQDELVSENNWYFAELGSAYLAIRTTDGGLVWSDSKLLLGKEKAIFVLRFAGKSDYKNFEAFKHEICSNEFNYKNGALEYNDAKWGNFKFSPDSSENIRVYNGESYDGDVEYTVKSPFSLQKFQDNEFTVTFNNQKYVWDLDAYNVIPEQNDREKEIKDVKIYGIPTLGETVYAVAETQSEIVFYEWYYENPLNGSYEYICSGTENELYIDEKYDDLKIKVKCCAVGSDFLMSEYKESLPIKVKNKRAYYVNASGWNKNGITIDKSGNSAVYFDGSMASLEGNTQGYVKVKKAFSDITSPVAIEFDSKNGGGNANIAYINGAGGVGVNINCSNNCYDATVGNGSGGTKGVRLKSGVADYENVHFKIVITPAGEKDGYVSIFADGVLMADMESLRNEVTSVCDIYFRKEAENGILEISNLEVYALFEDSTDEMFIYKENGSRKGSVCVITKQASDAMLAVAYYTAGHTVSSVKTTRCSIAQGINYFEDIVEVQSKGEYAKVFLFDGLDSLKPLSPHLTVQ